jgi:hypothetical protein
VCSLLSLMTQSTVEARRPHVSSFLVPWPVGALLGEWSGLPWEKAVPSSQSTLCYIVLASRISLSSLASPVARHNWAVTETPASNSLRFWSPWSLLHSCPHLGGKFAQEEDGTVTKTW